MFQKYQRAMFTKPGFTYAICRPRYVLYVRKTKSKNKPTPLFLSKQMVMQI